MSLTYEVPSISTVELRIRKQCIPSNVLAIDAFVKQLQVRGCKPQTIQRLLYALEPFLTAYKERSLTSLSTTCLEDYIARLNLSAATAWSKNTTKKAVKAFYKTLWGEQAVSWIKIKQRGIETVRAEDLLTAYEVEQLIESCNNLRDKTIIVLLWDTGIRRGELLGMKRLSVDLQTAHITVNGKTGERTIPLVYSLELLTRYIKRTTRLDNDEQASLWHGKNGALGERGLRKLLLKARANAKLKQRIYAHLFRHSAATRDAKVFTEPVLRYKYGWVKDSRMVATYIHITGHDLDEVVANKRAELIALNDA